MPQELWDLVKARQRQRSSRIRQVTTVPAVPRLLSGLLVCGRCGARYVLRGRQTYSCASRQNRGKVVCDCMATVNAAEAEQAILDLLEPLFCSEEVLQRLVVQVQKRFAQARARGVERRSTGAQLRSQLARVETEIGRLVDWIAKGALVEDLEQRMQGAQKRRDHLRRELAELTAAGPPTGLEVLPSAVRKIVSDLRGMLAAGQVEKVMSALSRLVTRIEVHEDPRPKRKRPGAKLVVRGSLEALLQLTGKVESVYSPGGILTPLTFRLPPRSIRLLSRQHGKGSATDEQRRPASSA